METENKHKHKFKSLEPDYYGYGCRCGAFSAVKNPKEIDICYEGVR